MRFRWNTCKRKPRGLSVITPDDIPHKLLGLELTDWPGISHGMEARFHRAGVKTTAEMYLLRREEMRDVFGGIVGERWWKSLRGLHVDRELIPGRDASGSMPADQPAQRRHQGPVVVQRLGHLVVEAFVILTLDTVGAELDSLRNQ